MARAVIKLSGDIRPLMPRINQLIEGCCYNPDAYLAAFNLKGMPVIIQEGEITIYGVESEAAARNVIQWLREFLKDNAKSTS